MKPLHLEKKEITFFRRYDNLDFVPHLHNALEIVLLLSGQSVALCDSDSCVLSSGDLFIAFPWQVHGYKDSHHCRAIVLEIPSGAQPGIFRDMLTQKIPTSPVLHREQWAHTRIDTLLDMLLEDATRSETVLQGYVQLIIGKLLPLLAVKARPAEDVNALHTVLKYLNEHYTQPLTRRELALAVGYSESYLSHLFTDMLHTTLSDYILSLRLDDAKRLLSESSLSVSRIAGSLGFGTIRSFNRAFRKKTGMTPSAYRLSGT